MAPRSRGAIGAQWPERLSGFLRPLPPAPSAGAFDLASEWRGDAGEAGQSPVHRRWL